AGKRVCSFGDRDSSGLDIFDFPELSSLAGGSSDFHRFGSWALSRCLLSAPGRRDPALGLLGLGRGWRVFRSEFFGELEDTAISFGGFPRDPEAGRSSKAPGYRPRNFRRALLA